MRIGIISDTHGRLRPEVAERLRGVDCILHAGDFDDPSVMEALDRLAALAREEEGGGDDAFYAALSQGAKGFYHREEAQDGGLS